MTNDSEVDKLVVVADSSQIQTFLECERQWNYQYQENLAPAARDLEAGKALLMGTYGHKLLEIYYKSLTSQSQTDAMNVAFAFDPDKETCGCGHSREQHWHSDTRLTDMCIECEKIDELCNNFIPVPFALQPPERGIVKQRFVEYCYAYAKQDIIPDSHEAVEIGFSEKLYEDADFLFVLEGRIDLLGSYAGMPCIVDHKFQLRRRDLYKKSVQFRNYAMVAKQNLLLMNMIRLTKSVDNKTFERIPVSFTAVEHYAWRKELIIIFRRMALAKQEGCYQPNWSTCSGKFGYECDFTPLCPIPEEDDVLIAAKKQTLYQIRPEWRPW